MFFARTGARRRLALIAVLGVGAPLLVLVAFGAYQNRNLERFLGETTADYGAYAAGIMARSVSEEVRRRIEDAAADGRLATLWGGVSDQILNLMNTGDRLLTDPFLVPDYEIASAANGDSLLPGSDSLSLAYAYFTPGGGLTGSISAPRATWEQVLGTVYDTLYVVPSAGGQAAFVFVPLLGFQGRVIGVAGWHLHPDALDREFFALRVAERLLGDPRVYHADRLASSLSLAVHDERGREVYRMRPAAEGAPVWAEAPVGAILPGWRVAVGPSAGSPYLVARRFLTVSYLLLFFLAALCLTALWLALRQASEQIRLAEAKSAFLANVSHELKTPLALIRLAGETLELGRVRNEVERMRFLHVIGRECRRLTHLINNVLDFAKIEAGRREFRTQPTDIGKLVHETLEVFGPQLEDNGFEITVDVPPDLPRIEVDEEAITRCLINLIDNAVKYSRDGRHLSVTARVRPPSGGDDRGEARISVADRGIGIAPRDRARIFEAFTRVEQGLVHDVKGSGLGLSLVRHIVEAHGGEVRVESTPGQGSTFTLVLPVRQNRANGREGAA
jgi:signal transduction histidine kinase